LGFQDRPYYRQPNGYNERPYGSPWRRGGISSFFGFPPLTYFVKYLLIINGVVFVMQMVAPGRLESWFAATGLTWILALQIWRLLTFQFLHGGLIHLLFNMVCLYFFGTTLERTWGSKTFLTFYLISGAVGGLVYVTISLFGFFQGILVGASGGILGIMAACAVLFPQMKVILFPIPIQIPIRVLIFFFTIIYILNVLRQGPNAGGDLCHLGGMATAFVWIMSRPYFAKWKLKHLEGAYQRKLENQQQMQYEVDRILAKVHEQGIQSLTRKEKQILQDATEQKKSK